jgi:cytochrome P450
MTASGAVQAPLAPGRWPLAGHIVPLARRRMAFITSLNACGAVVEVRLGPRRAYVVTDPDALHELLATQAEKFDKGQMFDQARRYIGNGLATAANDEHRVHRRMLQPAFHQQRIAEYAKTMRRTAEATVSRWEPGMELDVVRFADELTTEIVAKVLLSAELPPQALAELREVLPTITRGTIVRGLVPPSLNWLPLPDGRRFNDALERVERLIGEVLARRRTDGSDHGDLLSMIVSAEADETGMRLDDRQVQNQAMTFLLGGVETPAAALAWTFHQLAEHPQVERQVHDELDRVCSEGQPIDVERVRQLECLRRVIAEVLRLYASTLLMRRVREPVVLGGVRLPVGAEVIFSPYAVHRDPRWFPDPDRFDPDRWLPERAAQIPRHAYIPFGSGPRICIAGAFARVELATVVATVAANWRLRPAPGEQVRAVAHAVVHPSRLTMICEPRG